MRIQPQVSISRNLGVPSIPVREHVLPGDEHAGVDLASSADRWFAGGAGCFVRVRVFSPDYAFATALTFDSEGFGTLVSAGFSPVAGLPDAVRDAVDAYDDVIVLCDEGLRLDELELGGATRRRFDRVRLYEEHVLGVRRGDGDLSASAWADARCGSRAAELVLAAAARADLFALVALRGADITLH